MMVKTLRYITAALLLICVAFGFWQDIQTSRTAVLDGPFAHPIYYTFELNKIILAALLALILIFDFSVILPSWGRRLLRMFGIACVGLSLVGFFFLIRQLIDEAVNWRYIVEFFIFQLAYLMVSLIVLAKSYQSKPVNMNVAGDGND